jgi:hypothetical protein
MNEDIQQYLMNGYSIVSEDNNGVILQEPKKFNWWALIVWTVFTGGPGAAFYIFWFLVRSPKRVSLAK